jgi:hypothetical protein
LLKTSGALKSLALWGAFLSFASENKHYTPLHSNSQQSKIKKGRQPFFFARIPFGTNSKKRSFTISCARIYVHTPDILHKYGGGREGGQSGGSFHALHQKNSSPELIKD